MKTGGSSDVTQLRFVLPEETYILFYLPHGAEVFLRK